MDSIATVRLDVWLWAARVFRTRTLARQAVDAGKVTVNGLPAKPAKALHVGDRLRVTRGVERLELDVLALSEVRGSAAAATALYRETEAGRAVRLAAQEQARLMRLGYAQPPTRPDKRARREIKKLMDSE